ncbi:uncharacterized protein LOC141949375 isoform X3 [Strix uralensis]|uniref:uncharacterized protein LOC141949375 isoform X3 n=1 Tax=Strix uralensis TaxID=36305 RepID=UPI003DA4B897
MREHRAFCPQSIRLGQGTKLGQADWKCVSPEEVTNSLEFLLSVSETSPVRAKRRLSIISLRTQSVLNCVSGPRRKKESIFTLPVQPGKKVFDSVIGAS